MWKAKQGYFLILPALLVLIPISIYPLVSTFRLSFHEWNLFKSKSMGLFVGFANYKRALIDPFFQTSALTTCIFVSLSVGIEVCLGLGISLLLNKDKIFHKFVKRILIIPFILCPALIGYSWRFFFNPEFGIMDYLFKSTALVGREVVWLGDKRWAMAVLLFTDIWQWTPFMILILSAGLSSVPRELCDAAGIDGASKIQLLRFIIIPLLIPTLGVALIIKTIYSVKMFDKVFVLTQGGPGRATEVLALYTYREGFIFFHMGYAAALAYLLVIILIVLVTLYSRILYRETK